MDIYNFSSVNNISPFAPYYSYSIGIADLSNEINLKTLTSNLLVKEKEIISKYPSDIDGDTGLGKDSVTARFPHYTLWQYKEFKHLKSIVKKHHDVYCSSLNVNTDKIYSQAWFNVMRIGEKINKHSHNISPYSYLSAHLTVNAKDTKTYYFNPLSGERWGEDNINGKLTFFPSWIEHETDKVEIEQERITIALDIYNQASFTQDVYDNKKYRWHEL